MYRQVVEQLKQWKDKQGRKPLILNGARQVGKTYILKQFGKECFANMVYVNCDNNSELSAIFGPDYDVQRILRLLSALANESITPGKTLIVFDEVQESPQVLGALKYFCEDAPEYHLAVAGSLLGVSLHSGVSFPVGKVETLTMYPLSFDEFLMATGNDMLAKLDAEGEVQVMSSLHNKYIDLLRQYYYVGGMPEVVKAYINHHDLLQVREIQKEILFNYQRDFSKHAPQAEVPRINMVWQSIPSQLARENKKFIYGALRKGARANDFEIAIQWLIDAGLVYRVQRASSPQLPLKFYEDQSAFKLFMLDVGLMAAMSDVPSVSILVRNDALVEFKGAYTELYVLTQLKGLGVPIYYYSTNDSRTEIDFLIQVEDRIVPIEVKAEENVKAKSLRTFVEKHSALKGRRISMLPYADQGWMSNIPLYAPQNFICP